MRLGWTWGEAAAAAGGRLAAGDPKAPFESFVTDTRTLKPGETLWALRGPRHDAHDHLREAGRAGGWVVQRGRWPKEGAPPRVLEAEDTLRALQALAAAHRARLGTKLAAITGSNGKTTTKQMLRSVCGFAGPTCATQGNLNNHVGLPLSLLELEPGHRFGVFELGASARGEIALLTRLCRPDAAVLTNVSEAHLGVFGSIEAVFETKAELARESRGPVALNADDPRLAALLPELGARAVAFGRAAGSRVRVEDAPAALVVDGRRVALSGAAAEPVNRMNAAAAAAGALALGLGWREIAPGLAHFSPPPMRMERRRHPTGALIVLDAYNANPASMRASLESFLETCGRPRRIAVLGDMKELGPASAEAHRRLGEWLAGRGLSEVYLAGPEIRPAAEALKAAGGKAVWSEDPLAFAPELKRGLGPDAALFLKASRAIALERLLERL